MYRERLLDDFSRPDALFHGSEWESLNPGYWQIKDGTLRRRLKNYGDRARRTGFPYHAETNTRSAMETDYDPSLPEGILWRRDWKLKGNYRITVRGTFRQPIPEAGQGDKAEWQMFQPGYGMVGVAMGGKNLFEGYGREPNTTIHGWQDDATLAVVGEPKWVKAKRSKGDGITGPETVEAFGNGGLEMLFC